jgi:hypothetical protein
MRGPLDECLLSEQAFLFGTTTRQEWSLRV